jgi:hypothetical protein
MPGGAGCGQRKQKRTGQVPVPEDAEPVSLDAALTSDRPPVEAEVGSVKSRIYRVPPFNKMSWNIAFSFLITGVWGCAAILQFVVDWRTGLVLTAVWFAFAGFFILIDFYDDSRLDVGADRLRLKDSRRQPWREYQRAQIGSVVVSYNSLDVLSVDGRRLDFLLVPPTVGPSPRVRRALERHGWLAETVSPPRPKS